jgi:hypothetical protein
MTNGGPDSHSHVTQVELMTDNTVVLTVQFDGFAASEPVEISGYVVQAHGAYSSFHLETIVPNHLSQADGTVQVPVTIDNIAGLRNSDKMMVVTKVAKVWPTVLASDEYSAATPGVQATWKAKPAPPWGANW